MRGIRKSMIMVIQICPESAHAGGLVSGDVRSWYNAATTLGINDLMIIK